MELGKASFLIEAQVFGGPQVDKLNDSLKKTGEAAGISAKQTREAFRQLPAQFTDVVTQLAGGANPFLVLIQQGGQVKDAFGGIGPAAKAVLGALTPMRVAMLGVAAAAGTLAIAAYQGATESNNLAKALAISGNVAGVTTGKMEALTKSIAEAANVGTGTSRTLLAGAAGSGAFGASSLEAVASAMARVQRLSGQTSEQVISQFSGMQSGIAKWAAEANKSYNFLTLEQYKYIKALEDQGKTEDAAKFAAETLDRVLKEREPKLNALGRLLEETAKKWNNFWDAAKGIGRAESVDEQLQKAIETAERFNKATFSNQSSLSWKDGMFFRKKSLDETREAVNALVESLRRQKKTEEELNAAQGKATLEESKKVKEEADGTAKRMADLSRQMGGVLIERASQERLAAIQRAQTDLETTFKQGAMTEEQYARRSLDLKRATLEQEVDLIRQRIALERSRPDGNKVQNLERELAVAQLQSQLLVAQSKIPVAMAEGASAIAEKQLADSRAKAKEFESVYLKANSALKQLAEDNERARIALMPNGADKQNAEIDRQIAEIEDRARKLAVELNSFKIGLDPDSAAVVQAQIDELAKRTAEAVSLANQRRPSEDWIVGAKKGYEEWAASATDMAIQIKEATVGAFQGMTNALANFIMTGKLQFKDFARSVLADLSQIVAKQLLLNSLKAGFGGTAIGDFLGIKAANGAAFSGGLRAFANGGVVGGPTLFKFAQGGQMRNGLMGEAGPEAIMPLRRTSSGRLGVEVAGGSGGGTNVQVNVNMTTGESSAQSDSTAGAQLGRNLAAAVKQVLIQEQRPGGLLYA